MSKIPYLSQILADVVTEIGATLWLEPEFGQAGIITFSSGKTYLYRSRGLNINLAGSIHVSKNKGYSHMFLQKFGYSVVESRTFFSDLMDLSRDGQYGVQSALRYAESIGFPVIIKPNDLSQGRGVQKVNTPEEFMQGVGLILQMSDVFRVESLFSGDDYRIVVLDDEVISAYERIPLSVVGDGQHTIIELLIQKQEQFTLSGRDTRIDIGDPRIIRKLSEQGYILESIPTIGHDVALLDNANLSTGGESRDVTDIIHSDYRALAIAITRDMGLRLCGVDIMTRGAIDMPITDPSVYVVIEVNGSPGLDHYVTTGEAQRQIVKSMYKKILLAIEKYLQ